MLNLNTHITYATVREQWAEQRRQGRESCGLALVDTLVGCFERGRAYVKELRVIMETNHLGPTDQARLSDASPIALVPVGERADCTATKAARGVPGGACAGSASIPANWVTDYSGISCENQ